MLRENPTRGDARVFRRRGVTQAEPQIPTNYPCKPDSKQDRDVKHHLQPSGAKADRSTCEIKSSQGKDGKFQDYKMSQSLPAHRLQCPLWSLAQSRPFRSSSGTLCTVKRREISSGRKLREGSLVGTLVRNSPLGRVGRLQALLPDLGWH